MSVIIESVIPKERNTLDISIQRVDGSVEVIHGFNVRTSAGAAWQAGVMGNAAGVPAAYIALSTNVLTPANGDTTLSGEITAGTNTGLVRALATYGGYTAPASLGAAASYTQSAQYTSAGSTTVQSAGMFTASSAGTLVFESNFASSAVLNSGDILNLVWTVNI